MENTPDMAAVEALVDLGVHADRIAAELDVPRLIVDMVVARRATSRPNVPNLLPWDVAQEHLQDVDAQMLLLENRRRIGDDLTDEELDRLSRWMIELSDMDGVIDYSPERGFSWVRRQEGDRDIVRAIPA